ncbi:sulfotransferase [Parahaliea mediterranea]|uniref:Sulfotransferase n=1 Tax=Parahaliea mediterranea TaxID=651086 RepID=A0A939DGP4_9GAMM|nr:sulfotransferase [Parahaliea mediterranea]MBN7797785.1 sulfotransferase [Parahaliea mediterranea]
MKDQVKVLYVVGVGRSGSTMLDTVLGNHSDVESVGELINASRAWSNEDEHCACGLPAAKCEFWGEVRKEWEASTPHLAHGPEWRALQASFERPRHIVNVYKSARRKSSEFKRYAEGIVALYRAVQQVSGKSIVLDSSKNPVRALALTYIDEIDLRLVHLIRDGRGVAWSLKKAHSKDPAKGVQNDLPSRPVMRTAASWLLTNTLAELAMRQVDFSRKVRLRYEDFVLDPSLALQSISGALGTDIQALSTKLDRDDEFVVGHTIAGNRMRMGGRVRIKPDVEWVSRLSNMDKRLFWLMAGPLMWRYGYSYRT